MGVGGWDGGWQVAYALDKVGFRMQLRSFQNIHFIPRKYQITDTLFRCYVDQPFPLWELAV